jgi:hypothetical protein
MAGLILPIDELVTQERQVINFGDTVICYSHMTKMFKPLC